MYYYVFLSDESFLRDLIKMQVRYLQCLIISYIRTVFLQSTQFLDGTILILVTLILEVFDPHECRPNKARVHLVS